MTAEQIIAANWSQEQIEAFLALQRRMRRKWNEDDDGNESSMRIGCMIAIITGVVIAAGGLFLAVYEVITQSKVLAGAATLGIGVGLITGALTNKAWQAKSESQWQSSPTPTAGGGA